MSMSDPLGDMLTRIRNGQHAKKAVVPVPASAMRMRVLDVLKREGFIRGYSETELRPGVRELSVELKYQDGEPAIREVSRVSKPGRRVYMAVQDVPQVRQGLGVSIVSTSKGVMSDASARQHNVGGEVLCTVF